MCEIPQIPPSPTSRPSTAPWGCQTAAGPHGTSPTAGRAPLSSSFSPQRPRSAQDGSDTGLGGTGRTRHGCWGRRNLSDKVHPLLGPSERQSLALTPVPKSLSLSGRVLSRCCHCSLLEKTPAPLGQTNIHGCHASFPARTPRSLPGGAAVPAGAMLSHRTEIARRHRKGGGSCVNGAGVSHPSHGGGRGMGTPTPERRRVPKHPQTAPSPADTRVCRGLVVAPGALCPSVPRCLSVPAQHVCLSVHSVCAVTSSAVSRVGGAASLHPAVPLP